jgi:hypothetical protein
MCPRDGTGRGYVDQGNAKWEIMEDITQGITQERCLAGNLPSRKLELCEREGL